jgi:DNA-binding NarL/FixJ family response regulator
MPITISLVEDHFGMRQSLATLLNNAPGFRCVDTYRTGEEAVKRIPQVNPDVVLVDIHLPGMSGIGCVAKLKAQLPELRILMLTLHEQSDLIFESLRAGACGCLLKNTPSAELLRTIEQVHAGDVPITMQIARKVVKHFQKIKEPQFRAESLNRREQQVLELLTQGCLNKEVAERLNLTLGTVRAHLHGIYEKLRAQSRTNAVADYRERRASVQNQHQPTD